MSNKPFSLRLSQQVINRIREKHPEFGQSEQANKGVNSNILRELIEQGLGSDPKQILAHEITSLKECVRDHQSELENVKRNLSTTLQVLLRNVGQFSAEELEESIAKLKYEGKLV